MRTIDADALSAFVGDLRSTLHKEQSTFKAMTEIEFNTRDYMLLNFQQTIDNAPTVEQECYISGAQWDEFMKEHKRPHGEWIELATNPPNFLGHRFYFCSQCNREIDVITPDESLDDYPYCHCGACMIKEEEKP